MYGMTAQNTSVFFYHNNLAHMTVYPILFGLEQDFMQPLTYMYKTVMKKVHRFMGIPISYYLHEAVEENGVQTEV